MDATDSRQEFAEALTALRLRSGLTVRELARRLDTPTATIGDYFSGRHLPGPAQLPLFQALLHECGVAEGDVEDWVAALTRVRQNSDGRIARGPAPYRGLEPFGVDDAGLFFGREAATRELLARLAGAFESHPSEVAWPLMVIGPSGSGKSSLLRAGLAARVAAGALDDGLPCRVTVGTPAELEPDALTAHAGTYRRLVVIDQFEEVFAAPAQERKRLLASLAAVRPHHTAVVAALRADFYAAASGEPALLPALRRSQMLIGPMTANELSAAIVEPARSVGAEVDPALVEVLLADLAPGDPEGFAHGSGALPLLSHALLATWQRAPHSRLTVADYKAAGGLQGAVSQSAELVYGELTPVEQELTRRVFCRLVRVDDDGPFTRRRVARRELAELTAEDGEDEQISARVLDRFIAARLLTAGTDTVEISHESLLVAWPRLAAWLARDRAGLRLHRQLTQSANAWADADGDDQQLLRGTRLQAIAEWASDPDHRSELNETERRFLARSAERAEAERTAERRRTRRAQQAAALIASLAVAAIVLAVVTLNARQSAIHARDQSLSRQVAVEATSLAVSNPSLAMQLAVSAFRISPTTQATSALIDASAGEMPTRILGPIGSTLLAVDGDGGLMAVIPSNTSQGRLYRTGATLRRPVGTFTTGPAGGTTYAAALSADGRLLATGTASGAVTLWNLSTPARPVVIAKLSVHGAVDGLAFAPDGLRLAAAVGSGALAQWSLSGASDPVALPSLTVSGRPSLTAVAYAPNGRTIAAVGAGGALAAWNLAASPARLEARLTVAATQMTTVAYSPDGRTLVAGAQDLTLWHWRVRSDGAPSSTAQPLHGFANWIDSLAFSHDGRYVAAGSSDNTVRIWRTSDWSDIATLTDVSPVVGLGFTAGDHDVASTDENGTTRVWPFPPPASDQTPGPAYTIDYTSDGRELAAVTGGPDGQLQIWNTSDAWAPRQVSSITTPPPFGPVASVGAMTRDGKLLAAGDAKADVQQYAVDTRGHGHAVGPVLTGAHPAIEQVNFSPNGRLMSVGDDAGQVHLYDISDPAAPRLLSVIDRSGASQNVLGVSYSPNGRLLAIGCADHKVWLWDISDPRDPRRLAVLGGFHSSVYTTFISPDGRTLIAGGSDDTIRLWDITSPAHARPLGGPLTGPTSNVYQVGISPDGHTLAGATTGGQVWLWSIADRPHPTLIGTLQAAQGVLYDLTFSPDDQTLVVGSSTQTMTFWHYHPRQVINRICNLAGSPITRAEWAQYIPGTAYDPPCR
jgi:WD40 repeat protein/transcriptional regulator with XRE-family HTH domain